MWIGEGWTRTRRQLGVFGLGLCFLAELVFNIPVPIGIYSAVFGLLGLGEIREALDAIRVGKQGK